uniref:Uncharacterized protein n=1 Tax=Physcomitrium patens TaxID=3218 RepID=A0A2K1JE90_PHYPA|nr:hypothetical protein PHYPA_020133 [Physcomitrium patens]
MTTVKPGYIVCYNIDHNPLQLPIMNTLLSLSLSLSLSSSPLLAFNFKNP